MLTQPQALRPLPIIPYDSLDSSEALVHKDLRLPFDGNRYCVPRRYVGRRLTIKADSSSVTIYDRVEVIETLARVEQHLGYDDEVCARRGAQDVGGFVTTVVARLDHRQCDAPAPRVLAQDEIERIELRACRDHARHRVVRIEHRAQALPGAGLGHDRVVSATRVLELILVFVIAAAAVGLLLDSQLPVGFAVAGIALMVAWWRFKLPPP